jgi:hypothetical protein
MKSLEEYIFLESIKVVNGSAFKEKAAMDMSAWNDWKEAAAKEHEDYVVYEDPEAGLSLVYINKKPLQHIATYNMQEQEVYCDDLDMFGIEK